MERCSPLASRFLCCAMLLAATASLVDGAYFVKQTIHLKEKCEDEPRGTMYHVQDTCEKLGDSLYRKVSCSETRVIVEHFEDAECKTVEKTATGIDQALECTERDKENRDDDAVYDAYECCLKSASAIVVGYGEAGCVNSGEEKHVPLATCYVPTVPYPTGYRSMKQVCNGGTLERRFYDDASCATNSKLASSITASQCAVSMPHWVKLKAACSSTIADADVQCKKVADEAHASGPGILLALLLSGAVGAAW